jgi:hypothetical protein
MVVTFPIKLNQFILDSVSNRGSVVRDNSLFLRAAITAPAKPIHKVKCCTRTEDATTPVVPKNLVITSEAGRNTREIKTIKVKYFSIVLILKYLKGRKNSFNGNPFLF